MLGSSNIQMLSKALVQLSPIPARMCSVQFNMLNMPASLGDISSNSQHVQAAAEN